MNEGRRVDADEEERPTFERKRTRQGSNIYSRSVTKTHSWNTALANTSCSKSTTERSIFNSKDPKCTHNSESEQEENKYEHRYEENYDTDEVNAEPRRKSRDRKKIWYPHDFLIDDENHECKHQLNERVCYVISEESHSYYPSESFTGGSSGNIKSEELEEAYEPIAKVKKFFESTK